MFLLVINRKPPCLRGGQQVRRDISVLILGYPLHGIDNTNTANCGPVSCSRCTHFAGLRPSGMAYKLCFRVLKLCCAASSTLQLSDPLPGAAFSGHFAPSLQLPQPSLHRTSTAVRFPSRSKHSCVGVWDSFQAHS